MAADVGAARSFRICGFAERVPLVEFGIDTPATIVASVPWRILPQTPHSGQFCAPRKLHVTSPAL
jgi:hypothetical protein